MIPFSVGDALAPPTFPFRVVGLFQMGFHEYDTRLAYVSIEDAHRLESARAWVLVEKISGMARRRPRMVVT